MAANPLQKEKTMTFFKLKLPLSFLILSILFATHTALSEELHLYYSNDMHGKVEPCG